MLSHAIWTICGQKQYIYLLFSNIFCVVQYLKLNIPHVDTESAFSLYLFKMTHQNSLVTPQIIYYVITEYSQNIKYIHYIKPASTGYVIPNGFPMVYISKNL